MGFLGAYSLTLSSEPGIVSTCTRSMVLLDTLEESESESPSTFLSRFRFSTTLKRPLISK